MSDASDAASDTDSVIEVVNPVPERRDIDLLALVELLGRKQGRIATAPDTVWSPFDRLDKAAVRDYIDLALCGTTPTRQYNIKVNPAENQLAKLRDCIVERDIDSVLVFADVNPWRDDLSPLMVPIFYPCLGRLNVNVNFMAEVEGEQQRRVDPGKDAAVLFAECGPSGRHNMYMMLPGVQDEDMQTIRKTFYDIMRNAVEEHRPDIVTTWPATLEAETNRARQFTHQRLTRSTRGLAARSVDVVLHSMLDDLHENYPWGKSAYLFLQMRGTKDTTRHRDNYDTTVAMVDHFLRDVRKTHSHIFVDMGIEIRHESRNWTILPRSEGHSHMNIVSAIFDVEAEDLETGKYTINPWCCLQKVAGADMSFRDPVGDHEISKAQVYTSDKFYAYNASSTGTHRTLHTNGLEFLKLEDGSYPPETLRQVYNACLDAAIAKMQSLLRVEVRIPYEHAARVYRRTFSPEDLCNYVYVLPTTVCWQWRLTRPLGISLIARYIASTPKVCRRELSCLTLVGGLSYMFNSVHSRPANYSWERNMALAVYANGNAHGYDQAWLAYTPRSNMEPVPILARGGLLLPPLVYPSDNRNGGNILTFRNASPGVGEASEETITRYFGKKTMSQIEALLGVPTTLVTKDSIHVRPRRVDPPRAIKKRKVDLPNGVTNAAVTMPVVTRYEGHDPEEAQADPPRDAAYFYLNVLCSIWQKIPDTGQHTPSSRLTEAQIARVGFKTMRDTAISMYLKDFTVCNETSEKDWLHTQNLLWPTPSVELPKHASRLNSKEHRWDTIPAWMEYIHWSCAKMSQNQVAEAMEVHNALVTMHNNCKWFFHLSGTKIFEPKAKSAGNRKWTRYHVEGGKTSNHTILIHLNPKYKAKVISDCRGRTLALDDNAEGYEGDDPQRIARHTAAQDAFTRTAGAIDDAELSDEDGGEDEDIPFDLATRIVAARRSRRGQTAVRARLAPTHRRPTEESEDEQDANEVIQVLGGDKG
ncbi:hypothetical protein CYLTODRAFT_494734 [Cylindrobasidium torrendii FP15055 ss-10]|uniref:Uncharacterized protein n=1 Tax=Cylindrobasidium torrendii FP15055 ss-10 TaxID=1314674 RepID=A0A0D7AWD4_9AGAR|nr:hypothetical protein CYLTODRAFT_494734 [Cylindrobasidium torrendii FP15055 ss-10]